MTILGNGLVARVEAPEQVIELHPGSGGGDSIVVVAGPAGPPGESGTDGFIVLDPLQTVAEYEAATGTSVGEGTVILERVNPA